MYKTDVLFLIETHGLSKKSIAAFWHIVVMLLEPKKNKFQGIKTL